MFTNPFNHIKNTFRSSLFTLTQRSEDSLSVFISDPCNAKMTVVDGSKTSAQSSLQSLHPPGKLATEFDASSASSFDHSEEQASPSLGVSSSTDSIYATLLSPNARLFRGSQASHFPSFAYTGAASNKPDRMSLASTCISPTGDTFMILHTFSNVRRFSHGKNWWLPWLRRRVARRKTLFFLVNFFLVLWTTRPRTKRGLHGLGKPMDHVAQIFGSSKKICFYSEEEFSTLT